jgi:hypothetical protein
MTLGKFRKELGKKTEKRINAVDGYFSEQEVTEFQALCKQIYGVNFTYDEAEDQATRAVMLMERLVGFEPVPQSHKDMVDFKNNK